MPLVLQRDLLGYIYADIDGAFGRFHDGDRDLMNRISLLMFIVALIIILVKLVIIPLFK